MNPPAPPPAGDGEPLRFRRGHFSTRLPRGRLYTPSHYWLAEDRGAPEQGTSAAGTWWIGPTTFATRMLGEIVELDFELSAAQPVTAGDTVGWIEGFKATADIFCVASGEFLGPNAAALEDPAAICTKPFTDGWLYRVRGEPDPGALDVDGYANLLSETIDRMLERPWQASGPAPGAPDAGSAP